ncbi:hypothetical protein ACXYMP_10035 [Aliiroseovarius sp. CAU 1755]
MQSNDPQNGLLQQLDYHLRIERPDTNRGAILSAVAEFLKGRGGAETCPDEAEVESHLNSLMAAQGATSACAEFSWLQLAAPMVWGRQETAFFGRVLRRARVAKKKGRKTEWEHAQTAIATLPSEWQSQMSSMLERSRVGRHKRPGIKIWSASHIRSVSFALTRWHTFCTMSGNDPLPSGIGFQRFATTLAMENVVPRSIQSYLERVLSGFANVLKPGFSSSGCDFVVEEYRGYAEKMGAVTKGSCVSASTLYHLGFDLMDEARRSRVLNLSAAALFRDGIMLSLGIALPQRARALAAFENERTIGLDSRPYIWINLPGSVLKLPQEKKLTECFSRRFRNPNLWDALSEYLTVYRPMYDDGAALFPSKEALGASISEAQIGRHTGNITQRRLGVRMPIHRFRDSAATEAAEELEHGGHVASSILGHREERTTTRHYNHAKGVRNALEFRELIASMRSSQKSLNL